MKTKETNSFLSNKMKEAVYIAKNKKSIRRGYIIGFSIRILCIVALLYMAIHFIIKYW